MNTTNVEKVFDLYVKKSYSSEIKKYLDSLNISDEEKKEIQTLAYEKYKDYNVKNKVKKSKLLSIIFGTSAILLLIFFFYFVPRQNINSPFYYSAIGSLLICFSLYSLFVFLSSVNEENARAGEGFNPETFFTYFALLCAIPVVLFYFFISWTIESGQEKILEETKVFTTAKVVDGKSIERTSLRGRTSDTTYIIVEFQNKKGEEVKRKIDISKYDFGDFSQDQEVSLIYSNVNDHNIKVLNKDAELSRYTNSEQRDFLITDFISLLDDENILEDLNKIRYGWKVEQTDAWVNEKDQSIVKKENNSIFYLGKMEDYLKFQRELDRDYKAINGVHSPASMIPYVRKIYENDKFTIVLESFVEKKYPSKTVLSISKK